MIGWFLPIQDGMTSSNSVVHDPRDHKDEWRKPLLKCHEPDTQIWVDVVDDIERIRSHRLLDEPPEELVPQVK